MRRPALHQCLVGATPGDAITDFAFLLRSWLREDGFQSELYAESIHPSLEREVSSYTGHRPQSSDEVIILHHSIGSDIVDYVLSTGLRILLIFHNITPARFFEHSDPQLVQQILRGREQLAELRTRTVLALGVSEYDTAELVSMGYSPTGVLHLALDPAAYQKPSNVALQRRYAHGGPNLLFVGRIAPNKCQDDLVKLLYHVRRIEPDARLFVVGSRWLAVYADWLEEFSHELGVSDAVVIPGHVDQRDLVTYYRLADLYVSMSEHEGFGKPFLEAMHFGVPILAYAAAAVPETLGGAGILFHSKNHEALAELVALLAESPDLRNRVARTQSRRVEQFLVSSVRRSWSEHIAAAVVT